jgi:serine/threonine protein kinase
MGIDADGSTSQRATADDSPLLRQAAPAFPPTPAPSARTPAPSARTPAPSPAPFPALPPGIDALVPTDPARVGGYALVGRLGVGGMGTVYLGQAPDGSRVAVKLVHTHLAADQEFRERFGDEVRAGQRVPAFCTARYIDSGDFDGRPYLISEYIDGVPLSDLIAAEGPLDPATLHALATGVATCVAAIHRVGLVHRDVKPGNVMVTLAGVRIVDFGIARALQGATQHTATGVVMGSLGWAAPEQLGGEAASPAMDVFGWGALVAYAATGRHPYGGPDMASRAWRIMHAEPDLDGISDPLRSLVGRAMSRAPGKRPAAADLVLELTGAAAPAPGPSQALAAYPVSAPHKAAASLQVAAAHSAATAHPATAHPPAAAHLSARESASRESAARESSARVSSTEEASTTELSARQSSATRRRRQLVALFLGAPVALALVIGAANGLSQPGTPGPAVERSGSDPAHRDGSASDETVARSTDHVTTTGDRGSGSAGGAVPAGRGPIGAPDSTPAVAPAPPTGASTASEAPVDPTPEPTVAKSRKNPKKSKSPTPVP